MSRLCGNCTQEKLVLNWNREKRLFIKKRSMPLSLELNNNLELHTSLVIRQDPKNHEHSCLWNVFFTALPVLCSLLPWNLRSFSWRSVILSNNVIWCTGGWGSWMPPLCMRMNLPSHQGTWDSTHNMFTKPLHCGRNEQLLRQRVQKFYGLQVFWS